MADEKKGVIFAVFTYMIWGVLPIYWKQVDHVGSDEILAARVFWAFWLTIAFIFLVGGHKQLLADIKDLWASKKKFFTLMLASLFISTNWFLYIYAVTNDRIVETSLGYYINPLMSMLVGAIVLKEKLVPAVKVSFGLAAIGVAVLTISYGSLPWLALGMAFSFTVYGYIKKTIKLNALGGLAVETLFVLPFAVAYYIYLFSIDRVAFLQIGITTDILLVISGLVTAVPLLLFALGAPLIPLYMIGFLQYIAPSLMLVIGVVLYGEPFDMIDLISFSFIWSALILFTLSKVVEARDIRRAKKAGSV
ncbi:EamA family transporter RarD [Planococcus salinus]|uniref:EamA family transporter RarD n=1 Tax=Planococcus salinus TaxID=1848460 RepID=A0A3M8PAV4_9BACL|nr:EamA family transporter RarD [Planococcus salinus]RNF40827.1 EamA family transporter RarD [Planococcus salinus]